MHLGTCLAAFLCAAGCQSGGTAQGAKGVVAVGTTRVDLLGVPAEYRALHPALEKCFERPVMFHSQPGGAAIGRQLEYGNMAFAIVTASEYAAIDDPSKLQLLATAVNPLGKTSRTAHVIARATDGRFKSISDCADKRFAFGASGDALTDYAARKALEAHGVPPKKILLELLPPPMAIEGRLYTQNIVGQTAASAIMLDLTVNAGVIDEMTWNKMPDTGGNALTGPSKDQFKIIGQTESIPEMVVVAGPGADPALTEKLKNYLLNEARADEKVCQQLGIKGFAPADPAAYEAAAKLLKR
jgi:ABC-type phosphate/phosphonate transport system substrate-binding protein